MSDFNSHSARAVQPATPLSYELEPVLGYQAPHPGENFGESNTGREFSLPPVDRGKDAWLCLMGGFCLEVMVWGKLFHSQTQNSILTCRRLPFLVRCLARLLYHA